MSLADKLLDFQKDPPKLIKDSENPHFGNSYISLDGVMAAVLPRLNSMGIVLTQSLDYLGDTPIPALSTHIEDVETGEMRGGMTPIILDRPTAQGMGSGITYTRRYAILSLLGLVADEDDDGNAASGGGGTPSQGSKNTSGRRGRSKPSSASTTTTPKF